ncbi:hypothetical protein ACFQ38_01690 [Sporosarcina contaminans]|uniref:DUF3592 domain-containing protein n=1 Tax=Sporosarcina contaminans TaxID=633403 RepID=A0ABW3TVH6_9BACL
MKKIWVFLGFLLTSVVITGCTHYFTEEFLYDYPIKDFKKAKGIVLDIRTEKGLYTPPIYYAKVELQNEHASEEIYPQDLRVSKRQVMHAIDGKSISGYTSDGTDFHTLYDVVYNSSMYLLFIFIGLVLLCFTLFLWFSEYKLFDPLFRLLGKLPIFRVEDLFQKIVMLSLIIPFSVYAFFVLINLGQKLNPFNKEIVSGEVISYHHEYNSVHDSYHTLKIGYETPKGSYTTVDKEVSSWTYRKYLPGDNIKIAIPKNNSYNVFLAKLSFLEIVSSFFTLRVFFLCVFFPLYIGFYRLLYR